MAESILPVEGVAYTANAFDDLLEALAVGPEAADQGPIEGILNELAVSGTSSPVSVATGWCWVKGKLYKITAAVTVNIPTPSSNPRIDRIVIRLDYTSSPMAAAITRIAGTEAASPTAPAITQTDGTTWDVKLAQVQITTGGVCTVTDERELAGTDRIFTAALQDAAVTAAKIASDAVTTDKIADDAVTDAKRPDGSYVPVGGIIMWSGSVASIPTGWALCDGNNSTPNLQDKFIVGAGDSYAPGDTGGADSVDANHSHGDNFSTNITGSHTHTITMNIASGQYGYDSPSVAYPTIDSGGSHQHSVTGSVSTSTTVGSLENRPPYYALAFIMRTA